MWTLPFGFFASSGVRPPDLIIIDQGFMHASLTMTSATANKTYTPSTAALTTIGANTPRYEYVGGGAYLGLLFEPSGSNLTFPTDASITSSYNSKSAGITQAASSITAYFTNSTQYPSSPASNQYTLRTIASTNGSTYTFSTFVRMNDDSAPVIGTNSTTGDFCISMFGTGTTPNIMTSGIVSKYLGFGVYRISCTVAAPAGGNLNHGLYQYNTQSGKGFRTIGNQYELAAKMTSMIPSVSGSTSRTGEHANGNPVMIGVNTSTGTFLVEHDIDSGKALIFSGTNTILLSQGSGKIAVAYDGSGKSISQNGGTVTTGSALTFNATQFRVGADNSGIAANGHIKRVVWHNTKLSASDLQTLTA